MTCSFEGCAKPVRARTWCTTHYERWRTHGDPTVVTPKYSREHKKTIKATTQPTTRDLEWAAGFMEGEGTFCQAGGSIIVQAAQVNKEPLNRMLALFGGSLRTRKVYGNRQKCWLWSTHGERGRGVALTLYVLLSARRQGQIRKAIR